MCALVTGVQTCALPILVLARSGEPVEGGGEAGADEGEHGLAERDVVGLEVAAVEHDQPQRERRGGDAHQPHRGAAPGPAGLRSEERRVGKECVSTGRYRGSQYNSKKRKEERTTT